MSSNFAYRYVALRPEHTTVSGARSYGTASLGTDSTVFGEVDDESFQHMFDLLTRNDMSHYGVSKSLNGKEYSEGGLNLVAQGDDFCGMLFYGVYGDNSSANRLLLRPAAIRSPAMDAVSGGGSKCAREPG